jgi:hypothetical protein
VRIEKEKIKKITLLFGVSNKIKIKKCSFLCCEMILKLKKKLINFLNRAVF